MNAGGHPLAGKRLWLIRPIISSDLQALNERGWKMRGCFSRRGGLVGQPSDGHLSSNIDTLLQDLRQRDSPSSAHAHKPSQ
jgi:hypothetical protein